MSRAAIYVTSGNPFLTYQSMRLFNEVWAHKVDKLYVIDNTVSWIPIPARDYVSTICKVPKSFVKKSPRPGEHHSHGTLLDMIVPEVKEDYVFLTEEDSMIFDAEKIEENFQLLEQGDVELVASPRDAHYHDVSTYRTSTLTRFWPNFMFVTRDLLTKVECKFDSQHADNIDYDTMDKWSTEVSKMHVPYRCIPQHFTSWENDGENDKSLPENPPWIHIGHMTPQLRVCGDHQKSQDYARYLINNHVNPENDVYSQATAWHEILIEHFDPKAKRLNAFIDTCKENLVAEKRILKLNDEDIQKKKRFYLDILHKLGAFS